MKPTPEPVPDTVSVGEARKRFRDLLDKAFLGGGPTVITRHGRPVAAVVPYDMLHHDCGGNRR